jgi:ACS family D-galactonate transporter-like MFS transporter
MNNPSAETLRLAAASATERRTSVRWRIFLIMLLLTAINYIDRASLSVALPLISSEFQIPPALEGLMLSAFFWSYALMQIPGGMLLDRFQTRRVIVIATVAWGAFQAMAAGAHNWITLLITRMGLGIAESPIMPAGAKLNGAWLTPNERGRGAVLVDGGAPLGSAFGAIIIASWRVAFVIAGIGTMLAGVLAWKYIRNHPSEHPGVNAAELAHITEGNIKVSQPGAATSIALKELLKDRSVLAMFAGYCCILSVFYGLLTWMPSYLHQTHGLNISSMGGATFLIFMCGFVGELVGGYLGDKWKSALVAALCMLAVAYTSEAGKAIGLLCVAMFFIRWCGMYWCIPSILGGTSKTGVLAGTMNFCGNMAGVIVPILIGLIVQFTGSYFLVLIFFVVMAMLLAIFSSLIDYRERGLA